MPFHILKKLDHKKKVRLSWILTGGLFLFLLFFITALLGVTYQSSTILVENEQRQKNYQIKLVSDLVSEIHLTRLKNFVDLTSLAVKSASPSTAMIVEGISPVLTRSFYFNRGNTVDLLIATNREGDIVSEQSTTGFDYSSIRQTVKKSIFLGGNWNWAVEKERGGEFEKILIYYKRPIIAASSGDPKGYLIGGIFLNSNRNLIESIWERSDADYVALLHNGKVVSAAGTELPGLITNSRHLDKKLDQNPYEDTVFYSTRLLADRFPNLKLELIEIHSTKGKKLLEPLFFVSAGLALLLILVFAVLLAWVNWFMVLKPLKDLMRYALQVKSRSIKTKLPAFNNIEFDEVARNLESIFEAFWESESRFQDLIGVTSDSIWETDVEDRYTYFSRPKYKVNIQDLSHILGKKRWELRGVNLEYSDWKEHRKTLSKMKLFRDFVYQRAHEDGKIRYWSASGKPRFDREGVFIGYRGVSKEITKDIENLQEAEETQDKLRQSQKLEIVGQLTGGVAHDFNNLLAIIIGNLELLHENSVLSADQQKNLMEAIKAADKGANLTHQLLAYSRQQRLKPALVCASDIIRGMSDLIERALGDTITLRTKLKDSWSLFIDPGELENALLNLAVNARDAMPQGGELFIECLDTHLDLEYTSSKEDLTPGDYVCVVVTDTGFGIAEDLIGRVLEPFFSTKGVGKGSGLGLSMVYGFVKQSGGHMVIYSEEGQGTSIRLYLPRAESGEKKEEHSVALETVFGDNELILIVEDNEQVRELVVSQLQSIGYATVDCADGQAALSLLETEPISILLSDVSLPFGVSGVDIANAVKKNHQDVRIILMSGFTGDVLRSQEKLPENVELLFKPFTKAELSRVISKTKK